LGEAVLERATKMKSTGVDREAGAVLAVSGLTVDEFPHEKVSSWIQFSCRIRGDSPGMPATWRK
jgi:hypothetical protein